MDSLLISSDRPKPEAQTGHLVIGCLIYPRMDQIDFTGPFEVLSRIPNSTVYILSKTLSPIHDVQGLILTPCDQEVNKFVDVRSEYMGQVDVHALVKVGPSGVVKVVIAK